MALNLEVLHSQIDAVITGQYPSETLSSSAPQLVVDYQVDSSQRPLARAVLGLLEKANLRSHSSAYAIYSALSRGLPNNEINDDMALGFFGRVPSTIHGGEFTRTAAGIVHHSVYGPREGTRVLRIPRLNSPLTDAYETMGQVRFEVGFERHADKSALTTRLQWKRK